MGRCSVPIRRSARKADRYGSKRGPLVDGFDQLLTAFLADEFQQSVDLRLHPVIVLLRRGRADVEEVRQPNDLPQQLQELGLPVLEGVPPHRHELGRERRHLAVLAGVIHEGEPAEEPVKDDGDGEEGLSDPGIGLRFISCLTSSGLVSTTTGRVDPFQRSLRPSAAAEGCRPPHRGTGRRDGEFRSTPDGRHPHHAEIGNGREDPGQSILRHPQRHLLR